LLGAPALSVPVPAFGGHWDQASAKADIRGLQMRLSEFANSEALSRVPGIDVAQLKKDLLFGLFFRSDIPVGYGLGSSGALCAAVYDRYCRAKTADPGELRNLFAGMERFFHGSSSGIDPLTSYLNKPLYIRNKSEISIASVAEWETDSPVVFLLDTGLPRQTGPLVQWFLERSAESDFSESLKTGLLPAHEAMVAAWLQADAAGFWPNVRAVSRFQWDFLQPLIPATITDLWKRHLESEEVVFKICGAGGGGFILGFAKKPEVPEKLSAAFRIVLPFEH
jgi:mevalonate kinase